MKVCCEKNGKERSAEQSNDFMEKKEKAAFMDIGDRLDDSYILLFGPER